MHGSYGVDTVDKDLEEETGQVVDATCHLEEVANRREREIRRY